MKKTNFKLVAAAVILNLILILNACSPAKDVEKLTFLQKQTINLEDSATINKIEGDAHGGKYFSRADSSNIYGCGMIFNIPDSLMHSEIKVKINAWVRIGDLSTDKKYAFSLEDGVGNNLVWAQVDLRSHVAETNKWINVIDSVTFPGNLITNPGAIIKTYSYNPDGKSHLDCDDVELSFYKTQMIKE